MSDDHFGSPGGSTLRGEVKSRFLGKKPVKLELPAFERVERCEDFLTLKPLSDEELIPTPLKVLHRTMRDWWDVARHKVHTWKEFRVRFCAAFLSENYEDEVAERVSNRVQEEGESIRDLYISHCASAGNQT